MTSVFALFGTVRLDDLMMERRRYNSTLAYNQSKLAKMMLTVELAERLDGSGITVNCVSPGLAATDLLREHWLFSSRVMRPLWRLVLMTPERAGARIVRVATSRKLNGMTGQCFAGSDRPTFIPRRALDQEARRRLWEVSVALTSAPDVQDARRGSR